ncbi:hypothetical protein HGM15179_008655 [Zosterops borbonicus]|uniref:Envelope glycoprotein n=1 Tax=Zosterops borbonicus TaxID=364589 RepID=A0A8K1GIL0_9PASS|nr:hypothetical protein HGM15179_008655 [Zosterops borbonicus]
MAAGDPISWGIITSNLPDIKGNKTVKCKQVPESRIVLKEYWKITERAYMKTLRKKDCKLSHGQVGKLVEWWVKDEDLAKWECWLPHYQKVKDNATETTVVWRCEEKEWKGLEPWDSAWSVSILQKFQYMAGTPWCIKWKGPENDTDPAVTNTETSSRRETNKVDWWACDKIYDCTSDDLEIKQWSPLAIALRIGCGCRGIRHKQGKIDSKIVVGCSRSTIRSPGQFVWATSDGRWMTHLPVDGEVKEITMGLPTLCPIWKRSPFNGSHELLQIRTKRDVPDSEDQDDTWQEPSSGVKLGWALESLFGPVANYQNREMLYRLTGQVDRLARVTREGFRELNMQLQATTKMTLQNRLALDMLLLKEHGVCGYLKGQIDHCCVHIPNVTADVEYDISQIKHIEHEVQEEQKDLATTWLDKIFNKLGWNVSSWVKSILENLIILLIIFLVIWLAFRILKREIQKRTSWNRTIMKTLTRDKTPHPAPAIHNNFHHGAHVNHGFEDEHPV